MGRYEITGSLDSGYGMKYLGDGLWKLGLLLEVRKANFVEFGTAWIIYKIKNGFVVDIEVDGEANYMYPCSEFDFLVCSEESEDVQERVRSACYIAKEMQKLLTSDAIPKLIHIGLDKRNRFNFQLQDIDLFFNLNELHGVLRLNTEYEDKRIADYDYDSVYCGAYASIAIADVFDEIKQKELFETVGHLSEDFLA